MKIRTDFVTNSSSYSSAEIMIDNPILLEILARYRDLGLIMESDKLKIGSGEFSGVYPDMNPEEFLSDEQLGFSKTPALYYMVEEGGVYPPKLLEDVLSSIVELLNYEYISTELLEKELEQKKGEINKAFEKVYWDYNHMSNEHEYEYINGYVDEHYTFLYDRENGGRFSHVDYDQKTGDIVLEE